jgi:hypothetical protein
VCDPVTLIVIGTVAAGAAVAEGYVQYQQADAAKDAAKQEFRFLQYQSRVERRQLAEDMEAERIAAMELEGARLREFRHAKNLNAAAVIASGLGSSASFEQGAMGSADDVVRRDLASLRFSTASTVSRLADQIGVSRTQLGYQRYGMQLAKRDADLAKASAVAGTVGRVAGIAGTTAGNAAATRTSPRTTTTSPQATASRTPGGPSQRFA